MPRTIWRVVASSSVTRIWGMQKLRVAEVHRKNGGCYAFLISCVSLFAAFANSLRRTPSSYSVLRILSGLLPVSQSLPARNRTQRPRLENHFLFLVPASPLQISAPPRRQKCSPNPSTHARWRPAIPHFSYEWPSESPPCAS